MLYFLHVIKIDNEHTTYCTSDVRFLNNTILQHFIHPIHSFIRHSEWYVFDETMRWQKKIVSLIFNNLIYSFDITLDQKYLISIIKIKSSLLITNNEWMKWIIDLEWS